MLFRHQGKLEDAIASLQKATAINPQYTAANVKLSLALWEAGRLDDALDKAGKALELDSESIALHYQLGLLFSDRGQFALAVDQFDEVARREPKNANYLAHLGLAAAESWPARSGRRDLACVDRIRREIRRRTAKHAAVRSYV